MAHKVFQENVSIVIPTAGSKYLYECIRSVKKYTSDYELIVITNNLKGFAWACNEGIRQASNDYVCFLNDDTLVSPGWLDGLRDAFNIPDCGISGPSTCFSKGKQCNDKIIGKRFKWTQYDINNYADGLTRDLFVQTDIYGFCMLTRKSVLDKVGWFDEDYGLGNYEETDLIYRMKLKGFYPYWVVGSYVHHYGHQTLKNTNSLLSQNRKIFEKKKNSLDSGLCSQNI